MTHPSLDAGSSPLCRAGGDVSHIADRARPCDSEMWAGPGEEPMDRVTVGDSKTIRSSREDRQIVLELSSGRYLVHKLKIRNLNTK
jgi:hypothetical protein